MAENRSVAMVTEEKLTGRALAVEIAEKVFGQPLESFCLTFKASRCNGQRRIVCGACGRAGHGNCYGNGTGAIQIECEMNCDRSYWEENLSAVVQVEDRIEELGLELKYATALLEATGTQYQASLPVVVWSVIRATPEERCWAALAAIDKTKGDTK